MICKQLHRFKLGFPSMKEFIFDTPMLYPKHILFKTIREIHIYKSKTTPKRQRGANFRRLLTRHRSNNKFNDLVRSKTYK